MDSPPGTVRSRVASGVAKLRARRAAGRQSGINNTRWYSLVCEKVSSLTSKGHYRTHPPKRSYATARLLAVPGPPPSPLPQKHTRLAPLGAPAGSRRRAGSHRQLTISA